MSHLRSGRLATSTKATSLATRTVEAARAMGHVHTLGHALAHGAIVAVVARNADDALRAQP